LGTTNSTIGNHHVSRHPGTVITRAWIITLPDTPNPLHLPRERIDNGFCSVNRHPLATRAGGWKIRCWGSATGWHAAFEIRRARAFIGLGDARGARRYEAAVSLVARATAGFGAAFILFGVPGQALEM
jgi:hypothetical protein